MPQNKYDDPEFFAAYSAMPRSIRGLEEAGEWPAFRSLLPDLAGRRVLDLGCGFGWHCRYARERGASRVLGIDLSEKMLGRARAETDDPSIEYRRCAIEDLELGAGEFDVAISSLALHYIEPYEAVTRKVHRWLDAGGRYVFSVEHPIYTALAAQEWHLGPGGERLHWPVDRYQEEGPRDARWLTDRVVKHHRTIATYINGLLDAGFRLEKVLEPAPTPEMLAREPEWKDEARRPIFILFSAVKG